MADTPEKSEDALLKDIAARLRQKNITKSLTSDLDETAGILKSQKGRLAELHELANRIKKDSTSSVKVVDAAEKNLKDEKKRLEQLQKDLEANDKFKQGINAQVAKSRTRTEQANAKSDDLSQKTATLSAAGKNLNIDNGGALDKIVQALAAGMAKAVTDMRALGLPAKEFAAKTLAVLDKYKDGIATDPALNLKGDKNAAKAKAAILDILGQHMASVVTAGELSPTKLLGSALKGGLKQGIANTVKGLPGMATMDKLASVMGLKPVSERINEKLGGKKGSLDQKLTKERGAGVANVQDDATDTIASALGSRTGQDIANESLAGAKPIGDSPVSVRGGRGMSAGSAGSFAEDTSGALGSNDALGYLKNIEQVLHELWQLGDDAAKRDIEAAQDANEARGEKNTDAAAAAANAPVPVGNAPVAVGEGGDKGGGGGAGAGIGGFVGGLGGGVISGFMKAVGSAASVAGQFVVAMAGFGAGLAAFFIIMAGAAKIIQAFGGGEAIQSLLTNVANGLGELGKIDGLNLIAVGLGMVSVGAGLVALTGGSILTGLGSLLTLGDPLGDTARSLLPYEDIDGKNLIAVGEGMVVLAAGMLAISASKVVSGLGNLFSGALGFFTGDNKKPSIIGYLKQFEEIDSTKLRAAAHAVSILGKGLLDMASGLENLAKITPEQMGSVIDLTQRAQSLPGGGGGGAVAAPAAGSSEFTTSSESVRATLSGDADGKLAAMLKGSFDRQPAGGGGGAQPAGAVSAGALKFTSKSGSEQSFQALTPGFKTRVIAAATEYHAKTGKAIQINSAKRDPNDQQRLWDESVKAGRPGRGPGGMAIAKPGRSRHEKGSAVDIQNFKDPIAVAAMNRQGLSQGVPGDPVHFQLGTGSPQENADQAPVAVNASGTGSPSAPSSLGGSLTASNMGASGTSSPSAPSPQAGPAAATRDAGAVSAGTAGLASAGAAAPMMVANIGGPPAPAAPSVTMMMPIPIPIRPRTEDMVLRAIQSVNYV